MANEYYNGKKEMVGASLKLFS